MEVLELPSTQVNIFFRTTLNSVSRCKCEKISLKSSRNAECYICEYCSERKFHRKNSDNSCSSCEDDFNIQS